MVPTLSHVFSMLTKDVHSLEYNAKTQYNFHRAMALFWLSSMIAVPFIPWLWGGNVGILIVLEVSLYANFATEFGSMSSALAADQPSTKTVI